MLGGTSGLNGMIYIRGHARDYDIWRQLGLAGWSYAEVLPYFKRAERNARGADAWHGGEGPLDVCDARYDNPLFDAFIEAGQQAGQPSSAAEVFSAFSAALSSASRLGRSAFSLSITMRLL